GQFPLSDRPPVAVASLIAPEHPLDGEVDRGAAPDEAVTSDDLLLSVGMPIEVTVRRDLREILDRRAAPGPATFGARQERTDAGLEQAPRILGARGQERRRVVEVERIAEIADAAHGVALARRQAIRTRLQVGVRLEQEEIEGIAADGVAILLRDNRE